MAGKQKTIVIIAIITQLAKAGTLYRQAHILQSPYKDVARKNDKTRIILSWDDNQTKVEGPDMFEACKSSGICERDNNYPTKLAKMLLDELKLKKNLTKFTIDMKYETQYSPNLGEMQELCESRHDVIFPQSAKNLRNEWRFILNVEGRHFQGYRIHQCLGQPSKAAYLSESVRDNYYYKMDCNQGYMYREMVYLDLEKKILATDHFNVPSCCSCELLVNTDY